MIKKQFDCERTDPSPTCFDLVLERVFAVDQQLVQVHGFLAQAHVYHLPQLLRLQYFTDQAAQLIICLSPPSAAQAAILY